MGRTSAYRSVVVGISVVNVVIAAAGCGARVDASPSEAHSTQPSRAAPVVCTAAKDPPPRSWGWGRCGENNAYACNGQCGAFEAYDCSGVRHELECNCASLDFDAPGTCTCKVGDVTTEFETTSCRSICPHDSQQRPTSTDLAACGIYLP